MRFVIQRVTKAQVDVDGKTVGAIDRGLLVLAGIGAADTPETADKMVRKLVNLRIFEDGNGKTNLALKDVDGRLLIISQFTLYADCKKGNRPSFVRAGQPETANRIYEYILQKCEELTGTPVQHGIFGADMKVSLVNDGPFTVWLDSEDLIC